MVGSVLIKTTIRDRRQNVLASYENRQRGAVTVLTEGCWTPPGYPAGAIFYAYMNALKSSLILFDADATLSASLDAIQKDDTPRLTQKLAEILLSDSSLKQYYEGDWSPLENIPPILEGSYAQVFAKGLWAASAGYALSQGASPSTVAPLIGDTDPEAQRIMQAIDSARVTDGYAIAGVSQTSGNSAGGGAVDCASEEQQLNERMTREAERAKQSGSMCELAKMKYKLNMESAKFLRRCPMQVPSGEAAQQLEAEAREDMKTIRTVCTG
jgi:hypothetical protein